MRLVENKVEMLVQEPGIDTGMYEHIERCGRVCYQSEKKITEDSAEIFVAHLNMSKHLSVLEHGTLYLKVPAEDAIRYHNNQYSRIAYAYDGDVYVTTNYRVLVENGWMLHLKYMCDPAEIHPKRYTFKFTCSRAIANELVRHRHFSYSQESTRYCNYSKDKFDNELTFIRPYWAKLNKGPYKINVDIENDMWNIEGDGYLEGNANTPEEELLLHYMDCERKYMEMLAMGLKPQEARDILPLGLKTEIVVTGFESDWKELLEKRLHEKTGKVHPDMKDLMEKLQKTLKENKITL